MKKLFCILLLAWASSLSAQTPIQYDIVISGGRVIDPETKLDAIRNIGIIQNRIAQISSEPLKGKQTINATGLVVSPGFIDLHVHGITNQEQEYQMHDGVTTALELEWGVPFLNDWYVSRQGKALINYGAGVHWAFTRFLTMPEYQKELPELKQVVINKASSKEFNKIVGASYGQTLTNEQTNQLLTHIQHELSAGGLGIGLAIGYVPGAIPAEVYRVYQLAGEMQVPIFSHVREPNIVSIQQAIADAVLTKAPLHLVHLNSMSLGQIQFGIEMVQVAQKRGFDITAEVYPYTAASTSLQSFMFSKGWQERLSMNYEDLQWEATGERLTEETFEKYRKQGGTVIMHMMKPEWIRAGVAAQGIMIGSDGMPYAPLAHPRTAGTFSRVLGKYVREEKALELATAIEKMTFLPAKRLEGISPMMRFKGRIQIGTDADITIFNPNSVIDKATFEKGLAFSEGIEYVLVNGVLVLKNGKTVSNVFPGQAILGKFKK